jgi:hypothetical protein
MGAGELLRLLLNPAQQNTPERIALVLVGIVM